MKVSRLYALMAATVISASSVSAEMINVPDHFYSAISTEEDFNQWTAVDVNGKDESDSNQWIFEDASAFLKPGEFDADDWLFSPKVTLTGGKEYIVKVNYFADYPCTFQITMGKDATPEGQTGISEMIERDGEGYEVFSLPEGVEAGEYHFGIHNVTPAESYGWFHINSVEVVESKDGSVVFSLVNDKTGEAIPNVELHLSGPTYLETGISTDTDGKATFDKLTPGTYSVKYELTGLANTDPVSVVIGDKENVEQTLRAILLPMVKVSGTITDYKGQPCADAEIALTSNVKNYSATTGSDGSFYINEVFGDTNYRINVRSYGKFDYDADLTITAEDKALGSISLDPYFGKPSGVSADETENGMFVSWMVPVWRKQFAKDNGIYYGMYFGDYEYSSYGTRFDQPMTVEEINWVVAELKDGKVDLAIYLLDKAGNIASTPVFSATDVPSGTHNWSSTPDWQSYKLDQPVEAPYGCIVAVGHDNTQSHMVICHDGQANSTSYASSNKFGWQQVPSYIGAFLIRAKGELLTRNATVAQNAPFKLSSRRAPMFESPITIEGVKYNVWRIAGDDLENTEAWTSLADGLKALFTIDSEFARLPQNNYRYAVKAISETGDETEIAYSKVLAHNLATNFRMQVYTNTAVELADGAAVTLQGQGEDAPVYAATVADNKVEFTDIPKGLYNLTVKKYGYNGVDQELDLTTEPEYSATVELTLAPLAPFSLNAVQDEESSDVTLTWNQEDGIFEDFESMEDFAINPAGEIGWTYADLDQGVTYGVNMCQQTPYPNMHSAMAFQAFNPSATNPDITEYVQPYSGKKVLVDVALENGQANNDYLFSPELNFDSQFVFRFHAASGFFGLLGYEKFMVGYTTGAAEPENVVWLTENPVAVGARWTEFTYTMPAEARHTVIRCVSQDCMFFVLDDIYIGKVEADVFAMASFNIQLDGEDAGTTTARSFAFKGLEPGKHIAKVQTVYTLANASKQYSDFAEVVFNVAETSSVGDIAAEALYSYDRQARLLTAGENVADMTVFDVNGRAIATGTTISLSDAVSGVYVVTVTTTDGRCISDKIVL